MTSDEARNPEMIHSASDELAAHRTAMAFERTEMATDRTLMAVSRTSLSLIGFGFTIFQFFHTLQSRYLDKALPEEAPRRFALALITLGIVLLILGILSHIRAIGRLKRRRARLLSLQLVHSDPPETMSPAMIAAIVLFLIGLAAVASTVFRIGPF